MSPLIRFGFCMLLGSFGCMPKPAWDASLEAKSKVTAGHAAKEDIELRGTLRQVGNAPRIECVVTGHSEAFGRGDYYVVGPKSDEISKLALGPITVRGSVRRLEMQLAGGAGKTRVRLEVDVNVYKR